MSKVESPNPSDEPWWTLLAKQAIADVIRLRARAADRRDVALAVSCYHEGAVEDHGGFVGPASEFLKCSPISKDGPRLAMWHFVSTPLIDVVGKKATSETYVFTVETVTQLEVDGEDLGAHDMSVGGRYLDRFAFRDGRWAIDYRQLVWDWTRSEVATARYWEVMGLDPGSLPFGSGGRDDPLYKVMAREPDSKG